MQLRKFVITLIQRLKKMKKKPNFLIFISQNWTYKFFFAFLNLNFCLFRIDFFLVNTFLMIARNNNFRVNTPKVTNYSNFTTAVSEPSTGFIYEVPSKIYRDWL